MSHSVSSGKEIQSRNDLQTTQLPYQFHPGVYYQTIRPSEKMSNAAIKALSPEHKRNTVFSAAKEHKTLKKYSSNYLCPSQSNRSISTGVSFNNDPSTHRSRQLQRTSSSRYDVNKRVSSQMIEETRQTINERMSTIDSMMKYVETEGFGRYHKEILHRRKRILSIEIQNNCINSNLKAMRRDENAVMVSNGKLHTECSINAHRMKSQQREQVNPNKIVLVKVELPQFRQKIEANAKAMKESIEESRRLSRETSQLKNNIKTLIMTISEQQKDNERMIEQIHFVHKQIKAVKEKISFYFETIDSNLSNMYRLVADKSLYYQDK